ncbi:MAG: hypothetical protein Q4G49_17600 [Paracoccus sp. (in: a-proteobacteria)]|nr:hypothetical protein [Paracoccus sp. (in: a-proteobacteria)]
MADNCTVITMIRENLDNTLSFAAWYLQLGAAKIVMFFDDPNDPAIVRLQQLERVECIPCTPEFWKSINTVPKHVMRKQKAIFT